MKYIHKALLSILTAAMVVAVVWIYGISWEYYELPLLDRPHHPIHKLWKPGGTIGHGLGITGTVMILLMLSYTLRKRLRGLERVGYLSTWLKYHIFFGIAGPILVTFHTAFKFGGLVSISYWSMVAVALSGFVGRYLYVKVPRKLSGEELSRREMEEYHTELSRQLSAEYSLSESTMRLISETTASYSSPSSGFAVFFRMIVFDITARLKINRLCDTLIEEHNIPRGRLREFRSLVNKMISAEHKIAFWTATNKLFHHWHVVHKPFAYTMIVIMIVHIITTVTFGYRWIF